MLKAILFKAKRFAEREDNNYMDSLSENTIILCNNYNIMNSLAKEICNTVNGEAEYNDYDCNDEDVGKAEIILSFGLQRVIGINGQRITLALEPAIIYKANKMEDIWLFDCNGEPTETAYEELIYPMKIFKGSKKVWESGKDEVYRTICNGQYGTFDGGWVNLD